MRSSRLTFAMAVALALVTAAPAATQARTTRPDEPATLLATAWQNCGLDAVSVTYGGLVTLTGTLSQSHSMQPMPATPVTVQYAAGTWSDVGDLVTDGAGATSVAFAATRSGRYRLSYAGDATYGASVGPTFVLTVVGELTSSLHPPTTLRGRPALVRGTVRPGGRVVLQHSTARGWRNAQAGTVAASYQFVLRPRESGSYAYRVVRPASGGTPTMVGPVLRLSIYRAGLVGIRADAPGTDVRNLNGEYAVITNTGAVAIRLQGWQLAAGDSRRRWLLPAGRLAPARSVRVHTGRGRNTTSDLYLGLRRPIWRDRGDTGTLLDPIGVVVSRYRYT